MKKILLAIILLCSFNSFAAKYYTGIGIRAGKFNSGVTFKRFFDADNSTAVQLDAYYTNVASGGYTVKGFFEKQLPFRLPIMQIPLDFIYGIGVSAGHFAYAPQGYYKREKKNAEYYPEGVVSVGAGITAQVEYHISRSPITLGIEVDPFYEFINPGPEYVDFGVSLRYVFR